MLEIKNISKYFNITRILNNISFTVHKGKIFGIIGPNGAGKTTTLRIILGILTPSSGEILFNNRKFDQRFLNNTGYLPEERGLYPKSSLYNTLLYFGQLNGMKSSEAIKKINYWLERLNLDEYKKYKIEELSKGNQQKVQFISSILHEPEILILDEPFSGFDPVNQTIFREIIEEQKNDKFIILSTHLMNLAENLCDEIIMLNKGENVLTGNIKNLLQYNDQNLFRLTLNDDKFLEPSNSYSIIERDRNNIVIDLMDSDPGKILNEINKNENVIEFAKLKPSLHQLFISQVKSKN